MNSIFISIVLRIIRVGVAAISSQVATEIPGVVNVLPAPYNLVLIPVLSAIGKLLRDKYNPTNTTGHWTNYLPI